MVSVNGNMVPPLGFGDHQGPMGGRVTFPGLKGDGGQSVTGLVQNKASGSDPWPPKVPLPGWAASVSVTTEGASGGGAGKPAKACKATIYLHVSLTGTCSAKKAQDTIELLEAAAALLGGQCPCKQPPPEGKRAREPGYCEVEIVLVWHAKPESPGVVNIKVQCGGVPPTTGDGNSETGEIAFDGDILARGESFAAHELGHVLYGTGSQSPSLSNQSGSENWDADGHNRDDEGLMRDTQKSGSGRGIARGDKPTDFERCWLAAKAGLDMDACCYETGAGIDRRQEEEVPVYAPTQLITGSSFVT
jgi:hypothetical protein